MNPFLCLNPSVTPHCTSDRSQTSPHDLQGMVVPWTLSRFTGPHFLLSTVILWLQTHQFMTVDTAFPPRGSPRLASSPLNLSGGWLRALLCSAHCSGIFSGLTCLSGFLPVRWSLPLHPVFISLQSSTQFVIVHLIMRFGFIV